jgi:CHAT domain-containing protein
MTELSVGVTNGNLRFARQPLLMGHYQSLALSGSEQVMDTLLDGMMQEVLARGSYPDQPKKCRVFPNKRVNADNPLQLARPPAVIVLGLGDEGTLEGKDLAVSVCQGVLEWASERAGSREAPFELAAMLVGSGGSRMGVGQSALMVVQGIVDANVWLGKRSRPGVSRVLLVEMYLDRATEAWCALRDRMAAGAAGFQLDDHIDTGLGALPRPIDVSYRGADYDWISAAPEGQDDSYAISYTVSTKRARTEVRAKSAQVNLLRQLVQREDDPVVGRTLFRLLVPGELQAFLTTSCQTVIELDSRTAAIPWELLDAGDDSEPLPWAICSQVIRKLRTREIGGRRLAGAEAHALVIGEPKCDEKRYPRLPGASVEAKAVANILDRTPVFGPSRVRRLIRSDSSGVDAPEVVATLLDSNWRVVHIAGHGELPEWIAATDGTAKPRSGPGEPRGVVLSDGAFLGQREFESMNKVPELVFVNCCHLAAQGSDRLVAGDLAARAHDRVRFAASLAESLIALGVRCVVAAGWAVEDEPAQVFATTFYENLSRSVRFTDAVARARVAARAMGGNTWAAYQCYGDPDWKLERRDRGAAGVDTPAQTYARVASGAALELALKTAAVNARYDRAAREALPAALEHLETRFTARWGGTGSVAEAFGTAWAECERARAIIWYRRALQANDGTASVRAAEQLGNLRARAALEAVTRAPGASDQEVRRAELTSARAEIAAAIELLEGLARIQTTMERESLCGSAWKRMAMLEALAGNAEREGEAIEHMRDRYLRAESLARGSNHPELFYPAQNSMAAELIVDAGKPGWPGFDPERVAAVRASLESKMRDDPDFWSAAGQIELLVYEAIARGELAARRPAIDTEYSDLKSRVSSGWQWSSVRDQLNFVLSRSPALSAEDRKAAQSMLGVLEGFAR